MVSISICSEAAGPVNVMVRKYVRSYKPRRGLIENPDRRARKPSPRQEESAKNAIISQRLIDCIAVGLPLPKNRDNTMVKSTSTMPKVFMMQEKLSASKPLRPENEPESELVW